MLPLSHVNISLAALPFSSSISLIFISFIKNILFGISDYVNINKSFRFYSHLHQHAFIQINKLPKKVYLNKHFEMLYTLYPESYYIFSSSILRVNKIILFILEKQHTTVSYLVLPFFLYIFLSLVLNRWKNTHHWLVILLFLISE